MVVATWLTFRIRPFAESPYLIFFGASIFIALHAGLVAAFVSVAFSAVLILYNFIPPFGSYVLGHPIASEDLVRMVGFLLVSLTLSSMVAACRRERNVLRESEERYRALVETASDGILILDEQGVVLYANSQAESIFGFSGKEIPGRKLESLVCEPALRERLREIQHDLDTRLRSRRIALEARDAKGSPLQLEITLGTFSTHDKNAVTAIIREVSERKEESRSSSGRHSGG